MACNYFVLFCTDWYLESWRPDAIMIILQDTSTRRDAAHTLTHAYKWRAAEIDLKFGNREGIPDCFQDSRIGGSYLQNWVFSWKQVWSFQAPEKNMITTYRYCFN